MQSTEMILLGLTVTEPSTWLTNWTFAAFSFYYGHMLFYAKGNDLQKKYWSIFFLFMGIASTIGGTAHGFINYVGANFHYAAWVFSGIAVFSAQLATLEIIKFNRIHTAAKWFVFLELLLMVLAILYYQSFEAVRINSILGLLGIALPLQLYGYKKLRIQGNGIIALGILSNIGPALIHASRLSYNRWFNFNDLSHMVMIGCFFIIYLGVKKVSSEPDSITSAPSV